MGSGNNPLGIYSLTSVLQTLKSKDFDRVLRFTNGFSRLDVRVSLMIQLVDWNLPMSGSARNIIMSYPRGRSFIIDK